MFKTGLMITFKLMWNDRRWSLTRVAYVYYHMFQLSATVTNYYVLSLVPCLWVYKEYGIHGWQEIYWSIYVPKIVTTDKVSTKLLRK